MENTTGRKDKTKFPAGNVENLVLYRKFEDFIMYFEPMVEKFPHYEHFALEADIKNCLHRTMELIIRTNRSSRKVEGWYKIDTEFEILRFYIRFAYNKGSKYLSSHSYETACKMMAELGRILGGLIKQGN
jgi:trehalose utilization protein